MKAAYKQKENDEERKPHTCAKDRQGRSSNKLDLIILPHQLY